MVTVWHELLASRSRVAGDAPALTFKTETLSYGDLWAAAARCGSAFAGLGLEREDRVAVFLEKRPETVTAFLGASVAGGAFVPVNPLLKPPQVAHILADSGARVLVTSAARLELLTDVLAQSPALEHVVVVDEPGTAPDGVAVHGWAALMRDATVPPPAPGVDLDVAAILYTSGSTGLPKGVVLSHRNLVVGAQSVSQYLENTADDVILSVLPLSFDAGLSQVTTALAVGAHVVLLNYLVAADVARACARWKVTGLTCVPPLWIQIANLDWPQEARESLRYFANTGGRMPKTVLDKLRSVFPDARPYLMYGLTEAFRSTYLDPAEVDRRPDSIGKAIPNAEILVVRPDGTRCDPGEPGELVHRGALVSLGYWGDAERTAQRFRPVPGPTTGHRLPELAVWSGDTVVADEDGFLYFVGRADEMIKTSGYRVSPTEVEEAALRTELAVDAVAFGAEDARLGQRIVLVVAPPTGETLEPTTLLTALRSTLPAFMVPAEVVVRDAIPRSPNGKYDRPRVRAEYES
ncbi:acyl-CoA ligase (AMP-forming), exosortase A system-associated [Cellulomonas sp. Leaf334]|uniref:acyl-CoA ligase (AMP-forming), exosortase A system-associated n=1 Tax=Cellulomonas sp. Leaf334 TaxID=1736339 RepID=UPI0006FBA8EF|nr:acyl-CoA ligase (AMP-forming), exosortase A system-associated [Cellulomonas sp. Leaf334]KQR12204.1 acyl--CoA ligase [Cellulomonas sp. Leaf334]